MSQIAELPSVVRSRDRRDDLAGDPPDDVLVMTDFERRAAQQIVRAKLASSVLRALEMIGEFPDQS